MRVGIDISQIVYEGTGVATYVRKVVSEIVKLDSGNEYILFGASLRKRHEFKTFFRTVRRANIRLVTIPVPPLLLDIMWNRFHIIPVEWFTGPLDVFWSSDWTQPPLRHARGVTTIHDLTPLLFPKEMDSRIVAAHKRRLEWVRRECRVIFCDSEATRNDVIKHLGIAKSQLYVVYPGL